jgi:hypothetical protein
MWQPQIEKPINWQKLKFGFRQSERLQGFERLGEHLKPFVK